MATSGNVPQRLWTPIQHMIPTAHPTPQLKRHPHRFSRLCTDDRTVSLYFTMGRPFSPQNLPLPMGGSGPPCNTRFPGPTQVLIPNGSSIGAGVFSGLTSVTDRQTDRPTDHATRLVRIGRIYVRSTAMRPNNNTADTTSEVEVPTVSIHPLTAVVISVSMV